jgi:hypothetical protein
MAAQECDKSLSAGCSADSAGCSADSAGCSADSAGCSADSAGCSADSAGCSADSAGCSAESLSHQMLQHCLGNNLKCVMQIIFTKFLSFTVSQYKA